MAETDSKDKPVAAMRIRLPYCTGDAQGGEFKMGEQFVLFGNRPISRGGAL